MMIFRQGPVTVATVGDASATTVRRTGLEPARSCSDASSVSPRTASRTYAAYIMWWRHLALAIVLGFRP